MEKKYGIDPRSEISVLIIFTLYIQLSVIVRTESLPEQPKPVEPPVEKKEESEDYSDYSYSEYSDEEDEDEDDRRRRLMIQRAAKRNNAQPENKLFSSFFESSKKLINEISNSVAFESSSTETKKVEVFYMNEY